MAQKNSVPPAPQVNGGESKTPDFAAPVPDLSPDDAIENQPDFKKAARKAWGETEVAGMKHQPLEAGFTVDKKTGVSDVDSNSAPADGRAGSLAQQWKPSTVTALHTHPSVGGADPKPSTYDVAIAKREKRPVMVASAEGLDEVDAKGDTHEVFKGTDWMKDKKPKKYHSGGKITKDGPQVINAQKGETILPNHDIDRATKLAADHLAGMKHGMTRSTGAENRRPQSSLYRTLWALSHGGLHRALNVAQDQKIPAKKVEAATRSKNPHVAAMAALVSKLEEDKHGAESENES